MRQAIEEGFILDVLRNYITYEAKWRLPNAAVEPRSRRRTRGRPAEGEARSWSGSAELHPSRRTSGRKLIVDHFRNEVAGRLGGRAKAMVVTRRGSTRSTCTRRSASTSTSATSPTAGRWSRSPAR